ncbi:MAG: hypothetical protein AAFR61_10985 [Bacteroidota bacterium]
MQKLPLLPWLIYFMSWLLPFTGTAQHQPQELAYWESIKDSLITGLEVSGQRMIVPFPPLAMDLKIPANARFDRDTIFIGQVQDAFGTTGDHLSLLYHEYLHATYQVVKMYPVCEEEDGTIVQWDTGETFSYTPLSREVRQGLQHFEEEVLPTYGALTAAEKAQHLAEMEKTLSQVRDQAFIYAPSNLAKEEIQVYIRQLSTAHLGVYTISPKAHEAIQLRLAQLKESLARRVDYERRKKLAPSGCPL